MILSEVVKAVKVAIISRRIQAAVNPVKSITLNSAETYQDIVVGYTTLLKSTVPIVTALVSKHAEAIASVVVTLEPMWEDIKKSEEMKEAFMMFSKVIGTANDREHLEEVKAAMSLGQKEE